jgi:uncharacterized protein (DUF1501 family)
MAITRRQFITRTGLIAAGSYLTPSLFRNPLLQQALAAAIGDRYLLVFKLDGGNDGLGTIIPYDNGSGSLRSDYSTMRNTGSGGLQIAPGQLAVPQSKPFLDPNSGAQLGFHPGLASLRDMYDAGQVAVLQGCGYPEYNLSHDVASTIWETGDPLSVLAGGAGWVGRYLASMYGGNDIPGVNISDSVRGEFVQTTTSVLALRRLSDFGFPFDDQYPDDEAAKRAAFQNLYAQFAGSSTPVYQYIGNGGLATLSATDSYPPLHHDYQTDRGDWSNKYSSNSLPGLNTSTARDLREVAKIIYGVARGVQDVNARFFEVTNGGYDTHSDQGGAETDGQHYQLHQEISQALKLFYDDLTDMGSGAAPGSGLENLQSKVVTVIWSEFGRRVPQNDNGTDHGSQAPMFVIGGGVNGGVYGNHPNINEGALDDNGNTPYSQAGSFRSTDFRDVYGTIFKHWLNLPNPSSLLPTDTVPGGGDPNDYWTAPNFDLPFL